MFSFVLKIVKFPPHPFSISILYITIHLYKVFKFIYKMCTYYFCCCPFVTFIFFLYKKPRRGQMDIHSCIKGSVALTKVALKKPFWKTRLEIWWGNFSKAAWVMEGPSPRSPRSSCALRTWTDCRTWCAKILSDFRFLPLFDAVIFVHHVSLWCYIVRFVCRFNVTYNKMCLVADCPESILNEEV